MSKYLTSSDYRKIVSYYGIKIPKHTKSSKIKDMAENILAEKLCRCIKKIKKNDEDESRSIAICNKSIFKNRGLKHYRFTCKKKPKLHHRNGTKRALLKIKKDEYKVEKGGPKIKFNKTRKRR